MNNRPSGFEDRRHTADVSLYIWADSIEQLFIEAAAGLYKTLQPINSTFVKIEHIKTLEFDAIDLESLLVLFLSELLFIAEEEFLVFHHLDLKIEAFHLTGNFLGYKVMGIEKEVKAITYHQMDIKKSEKGYSTYIIMDI